ncbi:MAG: rRNA maturation RNase YbeY [Hydrococcus sp. Prado102]|jgi:probable rRNA maturation factor|nr:rRNA maturation RNase YbeY [Hydrococcus sp. Prado102]
MSSSLKPSLTVDVNFQDAFFASSTATCPVAVNEWTKWCQAWLDAMYDEIPQANAYELSLRLTTDEEIQTLNDRYRNLDRPTDVLAFAALEVELPQMPEEFSELEPLYLGDIIISVETAERQAGQQGHSLTVELAWLTSHGFLHLLGWDHPDDSTLATMLDRQEKLLKIIGFLSQD